jgi:bacterioferritin
MATRTIRNASRRANHHPSHKRLPSVNGKAGARARLIAGLNEDLAGEFGAIIQYVTYAARTSGPFRPELVQFFLKEVPDEQGHAQFLANKIVALGGEPVTVPRATPAASGNREMLMAVLEAEKRAIADYTRRARQAEAFGDKGLQVQLESIVADETGHYEETERILREWPM